MKRIFLVLQFIIFCTLVANAQKNKDAKTEFSKKSITKSTVESACKCIDSIDARGKTKEEIAGEINNCIKVSAHANVLMDALLNIKNLEKSDKDTSVVNININLDENSAEYKEQYYALERSLMEECPAIREKAKVNDKVNKNSLTESDEANEFFLKGIEAADKNNHKKAVEFYKTAVKLDTNFAFAWDNLGLSYRKLEEYDNALFAYKKSLQADPRGITPLQNMAIVYQYTKDYNKALDCYKRIGIIEPKNPECFYGAGLIYISYLNDLENGLDNLCKAYNIYIELNSPYRTDAEQLINSVYKTLKEENKEDLFMSVLKKNNIKIK